VGFETGVIEMRPPIASIKTKATWSFIRLSALLFSLMSGGQQCSTRGVSAVRWERCAFQSVKTIND
jgi:hypothetical protein